MQVLVYGAGAVGLGLGSFLLGAQAGVTFVARPATVRALRDAGLVRSGRFGAHRAAPATFAAVESLADVGPAEGAAAFDFVLVPTKSFDSAGAARDLAAHAAVLGERARVVVCQNGWGAAELFADALGRARVYGARIITGFVRPERHTVTVTAHAEPVAVGSLFGAPPAAVEPLCAALRAGGLPAETSPRLADLLWEKLLYNGCLNPLSAICGVPYGALGDSKETRVILRDTAREIFDVMRATGHQTRFADADAFLKALYEDLLPPTAEHESSMLQDLRAGRRTEIDALNGAVVRLAEAHGLDVPTNRTLCELVRFLEQRNAETARPGSTT